MNYESDEVIQEVQDEMYRRGGEESKKSLVSELSPTSKFFIGLFAAALVYMIATDKITTKNGLIIGACFAIVLLLISRTEPRRTELTMIECMIRAENILKFLQKHPIGDLPNIPKGKIRIKHIGRKQWYEGQAFKRSFAVDIYDSENDVTEMYMIEVDIFTGDIITVEWKPEGVYGNETKDIKLIPSYNTVLEKKRNQYLDKAFKR